MYQIQKEAFLNKDTEQLPAIKESILPLSQNTCARINALLLYAKGVVIEIAVGNELIPIGTIQVHPHYDDMLLVTHKEYPEYYLLVPGYTIFSLRFYERKRT